MDAIVLLVSGKTSSQGTNSWNANGCCCWPPADGAGPDDSAYLATRRAAMVAAGWSLTSDTYGIGQGGAGDSEMYRSACDYPSAWSAIVGVNGSGVTSFGGSETCTPTTANVLGIAHAHGTADVSQERYTGQGGTNAGMSNQCVGAIDAGGTMAQLGTFAGCTGTVLDTTVRAAEDLSSDVVGSETTFTTFASCPAGREVELWTMTGEDHTFTPQAQFVTRAVAFFNAHVKP